MPNSSSPYAPAERPRAYPTLSRPQSGRAIAGVAAGLAAHLGVDILLVRLVFVALCLLGGPGVVAYAAVWMVTSADKSTPAPVSRWAVPAGAYWALAVAGAAAALASVSLTSRLGLPALVPAVIVAVGAVLAWLAYDRGMDSLLGGVSVVVGSLLVLGGVIFALWQWNGGAAFGPALVAVAVTMLGFGALVVPLVIKLWRSLGEQRALQAVANERATIAARLHDSVLQTLALIQKRADDPQEVTRLARSQERQLRSWLFDADTAARDQTVFGALAAACGEVEDLCGVRIAPVTVGEDAALSVNTKLAVQAAREAMVNAGKHAGVDSVDVYAEALAGQLSIFVRDRGVGFVPEEVPQDRHGIRDSIQARMASAGGRARIKSAPGQGTEVEVTVALEG